MATQSLLVDREAFGYMVAENKLDTWEAGGYIYAGKREKTGDMQLYRTYGPKWAYLYQARRVATNTNAAGGTIVIDITSAVPAKLISVRGLQATAGVHVIAVTVIDEDNNIVAYMGVGGAAAAASNITLPALGATATAADLTQCSFDYILGPGMKLSVYTTGASGQANDTCTAHVVLLLPITATENDITWSIARSTNVAQTTLAASTISAANTMQAVLLP